jgi:hypothetical protein
MSDDSDDNIFTNATIKPDGNVQAWDDSRRGVALIENAKHQYWFTPNNRFDENGNDFWIVIQYFGFCRRDTAGNKTGAAREVFTTKQALSAKQRIIEYYSGPEDKIVFPFNRPECHFLGVLFEDGWVLVKN